MKERGATRANSAGAACEAQVAGQLTQYGFSEIDIKSKEHKDLKSLISEGYDPSEALSLFGDRVFAQQIRGYKTIYDKPHQHDIIAYCSEKFPSGLVVEVKWQTVGGSVDEKLPFVVLSLAEMPVTCAILLIDGGGMRECAIDWAKASNTASLITMSSVGEFSRWLRTTQVRQC
jgi:hypothetical protein